MEIIIENFTKQIKDTYLLKDVNMKLETGKIYGLQGKNGSGKTMLLRAIAGLIYGTEGKIMVNGKTLGKDMSFPDNMGLLIEYPAFLNEYSGYENLKMIASIRGNKIDVGKVLERVGLNPADKRKFRKYSLGMKQRLGIACAIMEEPQLLLLDEPFNALDIEGQKEVADIILEMKQKGALIILTSHDKEELERLSDEIFFVEKGSFTKREADFS